MNATRSSAEEMSKNLRETEKRVVRCILPYSLLAVLRLLNTSYVAKPDSGDGESGLIVHITSSIAQVIAINLLISIRR